MYLYLLIEIVFLYPVCSPLIIFKYPLTASGNFDYLFGALVFFPFVILAIVFHFLYYRFLRVLVPIFMFIVSSISAGLFLVWISSGY